MNNITTNNPAVRKYSITEAVFFGLIVTLTIGVLCNLLGWSLGISLAGSDTSYDSTTYGTVAIIWMFLTAAITLFAGGWTTGYLLNDRIQTCTDNVVHGLLTWGVTTLFSLFIAFYSTASAISGFSDLAKNSLPMLSGNSLPAALQVNVDKEAFFQIKNSIRQAVGNANLNQAQISDLTQDVRTVFLSPFNNDANSPAINSLAEQVASITGVDQNQAKNMVLNWQAQFNNLKNSMNAYVQKAKDAAVQSANTAIWILFGLIVVGAITAILGSLLGAKTNSNIDYNRNDYARNPRV